MCFFATLVAKRRPLIQALPSCSSTPGISQATSAPGAEPEPGAHQRPNPRLLSLASSKQQLRPLPLSCAQSHRSSLWCAIGPIRVLPSFRQQGQQERTEDKVSPLPPYPKTSTSCSERNRPDSPTPLTSCSVPNEEEEEEEL